MAKYSANIPSWTTEAVADTTNMTDSKYIALQGVASTRVQVSEIYLGGQATSSAPQYILAARDSTVGATLSGARTALIDGTATAPGSLASAFGIATTKPQRSSTLSLLNLTFNAFGGIVRWVAAPGNELSLFGATASLGELSVSGFTGTTPGLVGGHIIYEQM